MRGDRLIPLKDFVAQYHHLGSQGTIRRWIRKNVKGFSTCAVRCEHKYLIDLDAVEEWLEKQRVTQHAEK
jgi:hypothetical protein